jgi:hypothetical protein
VASRRSLEIGDAISQFHDSLAQDRFWPDPEVPERPADFGFLEYSGLVVLTASLSESDPVSDIEAWPQASRNDKAWSESRLMYESPLK